MARRWSVIPMCNYHEMQKTRAQDPNTVLYTRRASTDSMMTTPTNNRIMRPEQGNNPLILRELAANGGNCGATQRNFGLEHPVRGEIVRSKTRVSLDPLQVETLRASGSVREGIVGSPTPRARKGIIGSLTRLSSDPVSEGIVGSRTHRSSDPVREGIARSGGATYRVSSPTEPLGRRDRQQTVESSVPGETENPEHELRTLVDQLPSARRDAEIFRKKFRETIEQLRLKNEREKSALLQEYHWIQEKQKFLKKLDPEFWGRFKSFSEMAQQLQWELTTLVRNNNKLYSKCRQLAEGREPELDQLRYENQALFSYNNRLRQQQEESTRRNFQLADEVRRSSAKIGILEENLRRESNKCEELEAAHGGQIQNLKTKLREKSKEMRQAMKAIKEMYRNAETNQERLSTTQDAFGNLMELHERGETKHQAQIQQYWNLLDMAIDMVNTFALHFTGNKKRDAMRLIHEFATSLQTLQEAID